MSIIHLATGITISNDLTVRYKDHMGDDLALAEAAWVSTEGDEVEEKERTPERIGGLLNFLMKNRHGTPFEHAALKFFVKAPIAVFREWHRHRIGFSYNEESGRYRTLKPEFYVPPFRRPLQQVGRPGHYEYVPGTPEQHRSLVEQMATSFKQSYSTYESLLGMGIAREVARGVLPVYLYSSMYVTLNPRSLMAFLSLRTKDDNSLFPSFPMWEIDQCARQVEASFAEHFPLTQAAFAEHGRVSP